MAKKNTRTIVFQKTNEKYPQGSVMKMPRREELLLVRKADLCTKVAFERRRNFRK